MSTILNILGVVLILGFLVFIHELGHYVAARRNGIKVLEFGIGFPPRLFTWKKKGTVYSFNLIPFGGFVKLYGEDSTDPKILKSKKSYASKTPWQKTKVVCAGVLMNFLVFWVLTTITLVYGIDPMITNYDDYVKSFKDGTFDSEPGVFIKSVGGESTIEAGDEILSIDGVSILEVGSLTPVVDEEVGTAVLGIRGKGEVEVVPSEINIELAPVVTLPAFEVSSVELGTKLDTHLNPGDVIAEVNGAPVFEVEDFTSAFYKGGKVDLKIVRDNEVLVHSIQTDNRYLVGSFADSSVARDAGVQVDDKLISINGQEVYVGDSPVDIVRDSDSEGFKYIFSRNDVPLEFDLSPENGLIGVVLQPEINLSDLDVQLQMTSVVSSVLDVRQIKEPIWQAPITALSHGTEISWLTAKAFIGTLGDVATKLEVSDEVGGPVQVARLGFTFVQQGGVELLNFIALISLSLAVINILPIPALDGGRLLFIIIEAFRGKPLNPRIEAMIHGFGFLILIGFIIVVTFYDIVRF